MDIKTTIHYLLELQSTNKPFVFNQEIVKAIEKELKHPKFYKARENLLEIKEALAK